MNTSDYEKEKNSLMIHVLQTRYISTKIYVNDGKNNANASNFTINYKQI